MIRKFGFVFLHDATKFPSEEAAKEAVTEMRDQAMEANPYWVYAVDYMRVGNCVYALLWPAIGSRAPVAGYLRVIEG